MDSNRWVNRTACKPPLQVAMRKAILMTLLAVVSSSAAAGWIEAVSDERSTIYVDPATVRRAGDTATMWHLLDYKTVQMSEEIKPYSSTKAQTESDCKNEELRILNITFHSGNMGGGEIVHTELEPSIWTPIPPRSGIEVLWKFACGRP
jgi:hypothetical protein